jgi:hypothetical protein
MKKNETLTLDDMINMNDKIKKYIKMVDYTAEQLYKKAINAGLAGDKETENEYKTYEAMYSELSSRLWEVVNWLEERFITVQ